MGGTPPGPKREGFSEDRKKAGQNVLSTERVNADADSATTKPENCAGLYADHPGGYPEPLRALAVLSITAGLIERALPPRGAGGLISERGHPGSSEAVSRTDIRANSGKPASGAGERSARLPGGDG